VRDIRLTYVGARRENRKQRSKSPTRSCGALGDVENARDLRSRGDVDHTHVGY